MTIPAYGGGQGRKPDDIRSDGEVLLVWAGIGMFVAVAVCLYWVLA